jgi:GAF domain-containing protein
LVLLRGVIRPMEIQQGFERLQAEALQAIVEELRRMFDVGRCTLRRDVPGQTFPVVHEALGPGVPSLIGDTRIDLRGQPVVRVLTEQRRQVVQDDCRAAFAEPEFQRMLAAYGGLGAQIVTPALVAGELVAILSLHHLGEPRAWAAAEVDLAVAAADLVGGIVGPTA